MKTNLLQLAKPDLPPFASTNAYGAELRRLRLNARLTLREVANAAHITIGYLSDVERGRRGPLSETKTEDILRRIREAK